MQNKSYENNAKILLVEDNPVDIDLTKRAFIKQNINCQIQIANDGEEAYHALKDWEEGKQTPPTIVLLDLKMPRMNGFDVLKAFKQSPSSRSIPIIVLTSSNEEKDITAAYEYGANSYLLKPIDYGEFLILIQSIANYWLNTNCFANN
ncbi:MAG: response regulator [Anaerolineaceae bacterium]|nr:response regulator [Anaerolineaceae bacterium]